VKNYTIQKAGVKGNSLAEGTTPSGVDTQAIRFSMFSGQETLCGKSSHLSRQAVPHAGSSTASKKLCVATDGNPGGFFLEGEGQGISQCEHHGQGGKKKPGADAGRMFRKLSSREGPETNEQHQRQESFRQHKKIPKRLFPGPPGPCRPSTFLQDSLQLTLEISKRGAPTQTEIGSKNQIRIVKRSSRRLSVRKSWRGQVPGGPKI